MPELSISRYCHSGELEDFKQELSKETSGVKDEVKRFECERGAGRGGRVVVNQ